MKQKMNILWRISVILVLGLFINLPIVSALEISGVTADPITHDGATISWLTDEPADSFLSYGENKDSLQKIGDAAKVTTHQFEITELEPETKYFYKVESNDVIDDNGGDLYSFTTPEPDITPPKLQVELPTSIPGTTFELQGYAELDAIINLLVNGEQVDSTIATKPQEPEEVLNQTGSEQPDSNVSTSEDETQESENESNTAGSAIAGFATQTPVGTPEGTFTFSNILLTANQDNNVTVQAVDSAGNIAEESAVVFADANKPDITLEPIPALIGENTLTLKATISENVTYTITVNNRTMNEGEGNAFSEQVTLQEGNNSIIITANDTSGWETVETIFVISDTRAPQVSFTVEKGAQYYQGRAESPINGETEPGAKVYVYVYKPQTIEFSPTFDDPIGATVADANGTFRFSSVNFDNLVVDIDSDVPNFLAPFASLTVDGKISGPKQVPSGLQEYSVFPVENIAQQQQRTYHIFVIAEDASGKTAHAQKTISLNTCFSSDFAFSVHSVPEFQSPLRLNPQLVDEGREIASAVFNFSYRGDGVKSVDYATGATQENAYVINNVEFERACTQAMMDDESTELGCKLLPARPKKTANGDKTAWYVQFPLHSGESLSEKEGDYWEEFQKRQVVFPLKIKVNYQERAADGSLGPMKTQASCQDLSYFVDIPIDSSEMIPDFLANEGLIAVNETINAIDKVLPYLETTIKVIGVGCISSWLGRMAVRWYRIFVSKVEGFTSDECPVNQNQLLLKDTIEDWQKSSSLFSQKGTNPEKYYGAEWANSENSLDEKCPATASAWEAEMYLDQAYKWSCDRVFCRAVPAGWTSDKDKDEVDTVIQEQNQCSTGSRGIPLVEKENCQEIIKDDATNPYLVNPSANVQRSLNQGSFTCYQHGGSFYIAPPGQERTPAGELVRLEKIRQIGVSLDKATSSSSLSNELIAYRPKGSDQFIVAQDISCQSACGKIAGYEPAKSQGITNKRLGDYKEGQYGCFKEVQTTSGTLRLEGKTSATKVGQTEYSAGYTSDCFIDFNTTNQAPPVPNGVGNTCSIDSECNTGLNCVNNKCIQCSNDAQCGAGLKCEANTCVLAGGGSTRVEPKSFNSQTGETGLLQCVCEYNEDSSDKTYGSRTAAKEEGGKDEPWSYRQERLFKDTNGATGTYYPEWRYYDGRDLAGAFGADYLLDYAREKPQAHQVNPFTQDLGAWQSVCLSRVHGQIVQFRSILEGFKNCIEQAKTTGIQDAGLCKTFFSQHVCGLFYKAISYFSNQCTPATLQDQGKDGELADGIGEIFSSGFESIQDTMSSSISDIKDDYGNAQINSYFEGGAQGFTQSICMAAFGYDWPLGTNFITDAALAVPGKTIGPMGIAERELASINPATGTAIFNYNIGYSMVPGCQVRTVDAYLKCIGPEDANRPGIDCSQQECDCRFANEKTSFEGERVQHLQMTRRLNDLKPNQFIDLPIKSPEKVDSHFRYDHLVIDIKLDPNAEADKCFEEGYKDGKFYFPIQDVSPPGVVSCQIQPTTGRYSCPEVSSLFGADSSSYLESPYVSCFDDATQSWVSCNTPNLFTKGKAIRVRPQIYAGGEPLCLKVDVKNMMQSNFGAPLEFIRQIPTGVSGPFTPEVNLGTVAQDMFTTSGVTIALAPSNTGGCEHPTPINTNNAQATAGTIVFNYERLGPNQYKVKVPLAQGVAVSEPGYSVDGAGYLLKGTNSVFSGEEIKQVAFNVKGIEVKNLIGSPTETASTCTYQVTNPLSSSTSVSANPQRTISVSMELLLPDANGQCFNARTPVKSSGFGKARHTQNIVIRMNPTQTQIVNKMHQEFLRGNYNFVQENANSVINRKKSDLEDARALYYSIGAYVQQQGVTWETVQQSNVCNLLNIFFDREYKVTQQKSQPYPDDVTSTGEFIKIEKYLTEVAKKAQCSDVGYDLGSSSSSSTPSSTDTNLCTSEFNVDIGEEWMYKCLGNNKAASCEKKTGKVVSSSFDITAGHTLQSKCS